MTLNISPSIMTENVPPHAMVKPCAMESPSPLPSVVRFYPPDKPFCNISCIKFHFISGNIFYRKRQHSFCGLQIQENPGSFHGIFQGIIQKVLQYPVQTLSITVNHNMFLCQVFFDSQSGSVNLILHITHGLYNQAVKINFFFSIWISPLVVFASSKTSEIIVFNRSAFFFKMII